MGQCHLFSLRKQQSVCVFQQTLYHKDENVTHFKGLFHSFGNSTSCYIRLDVSRPATCGYK